MDKSERCRVDRVDIHVESQSQAQLSTPLRTHGVVASFSIIQTKPQRSEKFETTI